MVPRSHWIWKKIWEKMLWIISGTFKCCPYSTASPLQCLYFCLCINYCKYCIHFNRNCSACIALSCSRQTIDISVIQLAALRWSSSVDETSLFPQFQLILMLPLQVMHYLLYYYTVALATINVGISECQHLVYKFGDNFDQTNWHVKIIFSKQILCT